MRSTQKGKNDLYVKLSFVIWGQGKPMQEYKDFRTSVNIYSRCFIDVLEFYNLGRWVVLSILPMKKWLVWFLCFFFLYVCGYRLAPAIVYHWQSEDNIQVSVGPRPFHLETGCLQYCISQTSWPLSFWRVSCCFLLFPVGMLGLRMLGFLCGFWWSKLRFIKPV